MGNIWREVCLWFSQGSVSSSLMCASAAGKTQMAFQLSLLVQTPRGSGGLSGSACYLTTSSNLPTGRILEILDAHPLLLRSTSSLDDIHTIATPTIPILIHVLSKTLPLFINKKSRDLQDKPIKLLVIDALAELFHSAKKTTTATLVERSQNIAEISTILHTLASTHRIAIVVLNEVVDAFDREYTPSDIDEPDYLVYNEQSRLFGRSDSVPGQDRKEASLGLVWANQVNARIMLSRTGRRRYLDHSRNEKRQRTDPDEHALNITSHQMAESAAEDSLTLIRRMSVIFNCVSQPFSFDYIVTAAGVAACSEDEISTPPPIANPPPGLDKSSTAAILSSPDLRTQLAPLDVGFLEDGENITGYRVQEEDAWETYWNAEEIPEEVFS